MLVNGYRDIDYFFPMTTLFKAIRSERTLRDILHRSLG